MTQQQKKQIDLKKHPDPFVCKDFIKPQTHMWAIITPEGNILTETLHKERWKSFYSVTYGYHKWPQNWKRVYYNRGYRCVRVNVQVIK